MRLRVLSVSAALANEKSRSVGFPIVRVSRAERRRDERAERSEPAETKTPAGIPPPRNNTRCMHAQADDADPEDPRAPRARALAGPGCRRATSCGSASTGPSPASSPGTGWTAPTRCSAGPKIHDKDRFFLAVDHTVDPVTLANDKRAQKLTQLSRDFAQGERASGTSTTPTRPSCTPSSTGTSCSRARSSSAPTRTPPRTAGWARSPSAWAARTSPRRWCSASRWIEVPEAIAVEYEGELPFGIGGKDVILKTLGKLGRNTVAMERTRRVPRRRRAAVLHRHRASPSPT